MDTNLGRGTAQITWEEALVLGIILIYSQWIKLRTKMVVTEAIGASLGG